MPTLGWRLPGGCSPKERRPRSAPSRGLKVSSLSSFFSTCCCFSAEMPPAQLDRRRPLMRMVVKFAAIIGPVFYHPAPVARPSHRPRDPREFPVGRAGGRQRPEVAEKPQRCQEMGETLPRGQPPLHRRRAAEAVVSTLRHTGYLRRRRPWPAGRRTRTSPHSGGCTPSPGPLCGTTGPLPSRGGHSHRAVASFAGEMERDKKEAQGAGKKGDEGRKGGGDNISRLPFIQLNPDDV
ncbi:uncharacterized protein LOC128903971 [Rissa tridactyla]|uniref:uncharacterized protein LOC128903971 n=1 Tax=Rissa tridactyla TaxID=75485 RepID=UPI0023BAD122|nr:uncharacterized protein LOC128903971 [Rissa tridactyla]